MILLTDYRPVKVGGGRVIPLGAGERPAGWQCCGTQRHTAVQAQATAQHKAKRA